MKVGVRIRTVRKEKKITQVELGKKLGVSGSMIAQYETGVRNPKLDTIGKIADALGVSLNYLMEWGENDTVDLGLMTLDIAKDILEDYPNLVDLLGENRLYEIVERALTVGYSTGYEMGRKKGWLKA